MKYNSIVLNGDTFFYVEELEFDKLLYKNKTGKFAFSDGSTLIELNLSTISPRKKMKSFIFDLLEPRENVSKCYTIHLDSQNYAINKQSLSREFFEERGGGDQDCPDYRIRQAADGYVGDWEYNKKGRAA